MPINNENLPISDLKLGIVDIAKLYQGHIQVYPNEASITGLAFSTSSITNASQSVNFVVTGTDGAQYTLTGSTGATAPSGTQTIPSGGSNTHSVSISSNGTGQPSRSPRVTVATVSSSTPTVFFPANLQNYATLTQAAGPAQSYNHTLNYSVSGATIHSSTSGFSTYNPSSVSSNTYPLTPGATWYSHTVYFYPPAGQEFTSSSDVSLTLPSWASAGTKYLGSYASQPLNSQTSSYYTYISVPITYTGQSGTTSGTLSATCTSTPVTTTFQYSRAIISHSNFVGGLSPSSWGSGSYTGAGSFSFVQSLTVTGSGTVGSITYAESGGANTGRDIISQGSISGLPAGVGDTVTITTNVTIPGMRKSRVISTTQKAVTYTAYDQ